MPPKERVIVSTRKIGLKEVKTPQGETTPSAKKPAMAPDLLRQAILEQMRKTNPEAARAMEESAITQEEAKPRERMRYQTLTPRQQQQSPSLTLTPEFKQSFSSILSTSTSKIDMKPELSETKRTEFKLEPQELESRPKLETEGKLLPPSLPLSLPVKLPSRAELLARSERASRSSLRPPRLSLSRPDMAPRGSLVKTLRLNGTRASQQRQREQEIQQQQALQQQRLSDIVMALEPAEPVGLSISTVNISDEDTKRTSPRQSFSEILAGLSSDLSSTPYVRPRPQTGLTRLLTRGLSQQRRQQQQQQLESPISSPSPLFVSPTLSSSQQQEQDILPYDESEFNIPIPEE